MSKEKHTPGKWTVSGNSIVAVSTETISEDRPDGICIAVIEDDGGYEAPAAQQKANGKLLSAAPDLLASCKELREALRIAVAMLVDAGQSDAFMEFCRMAGIPDCIGKRANEAIKKAEGK